jgi:phosphoglycerol transferase MdoB-like AlkP superfamily enzyme
MPELNEPPKTPNVKQPASFRWSWLAYAGFAAFLFISSRMFLGFKLNARGRIDEMTSFTMVLFAFFAIEYLTRGIVRKIVLFSLGGLLIFFHLLNGLYFRFFDTLIPFDIIRQYKDLFVVSSSGLGLASIVEILIAVLVPLSLLIYILLRPYRAKLLVLVILLALIITGWAHRISQPLDRQANAASAVPNFIHYSLYYKFGFGFDKKKFAKIVSNPESLLASPRKNYKFVEGRGLLQEPIGANADTPKRYNVIFILMESFRAYECGFLGAATSFTPSLDKLAGQARIYDNFYANGSQTVRGEFASLCSAYPNPLGVSEYIINPSVDVISLPQILSDAGYETLWFSGYTADFDNKRRFLKHHGVKNIIDRDVLPKPQKPILGWGMCDEELFDNVWRILEDANKPFFAQVTTLSNHFGADAYPTDAQSPVLPATPQYQRYINGIFYTDWAVARFVERILNSKFRNNTIIIITGDHSVWFFPDDIKEDIQKREIYFRVPLCIWGPRDAVAPAVDHLVGSQVDIAPTVLDTLGIRRKNTFLGQSLIDSNIPVEKRMAIMYLGNTSSIRIGNVWSLPETDKMQKITEDNFRLSKRMKIRGYTNHHFGTIEGDLLRGPYKINNDVSADTEDAFSKKLNDVTFMAGFCIYRNAFQNSR